MILWGKISEFSIFAVLQFLAQYRMTGILEIQDFEEFGSIYLSEGRVDAISLPLSDDLLGKRMMASGIISEEQLKECLLSTADEESPTPLGVALLQRGYTDRKTLQEIVNSQIYDQALELANWKSGTFRFVVPEQPFHFSITPSIEVQSLLLDASRRLDEGERPRREKIEVEYEICLTCTLPCSEEIKSRFLKSDVCLWRSMPTIARDHMFLKPKRRRRKDDIDENDHDLTFL